MNIKMLKKEELKLCHEVIVKSFLPVAESLSLTEKNNSNNSAFMKLESLYNLYNRGNEIYGLFEEELIGCVSIEKKSDLNYNIRLLCVLSEYQNNNYGKALLKFIESRIIDLNGNKASLGMVYENKKLYDWYRTLGYQTDKIKRNNKSGISIAFMSKVL